MARKIAGHDLAHLDQLERTIAAARDRRLNHLAADHREVLIGSYTLMAAPPCSSSPETGGHVITVHLRYQVDPYAIEAFEDYARRWMLLVERFGGTHHGYFLPSEGDSDEAFALFSFPSLADYERYRRDSAADPDCQQAYALAERTRCIIRYERRFLQPVH